MVNWKGSEWAAKGEAMSENPSVGGISADDDHAEVLCHCSQPDREFVIPTGAVAGETVFVHSPWSDSDEDDDCGLMFSKHWMSLFCRLGGSTSHSPAETIVSFSQSVSLSLSVTFLYTVSGSGIRRGGRNGRGSRPRL